MGNPFVVEMGKRKWSDIVMNSLTANRLYIMGWLFGFIIISWRLLSILFFRRGGSMPMVLYNLLSCYRYIYIFRWPRDGDDDDKFRDDIFILPTNITIK